MDLTIVTGLSGAGRSSALKILEDMGFFCADNIPPALIPDFARLCRLNATTHEHVAVVADMRMGDMFDSIYDAIDQLREQEDLSLDIIFLDSSNEALVSRFNQTRRLHPVSGSGNILNGISTEREKMQRIKEMADTVIDTSTYSVRELKKALERRYRQGKDKRLLISVITFGYKRGIPIDADLVFDMRFLPNPFYLEELRPYSGLTEQVSSYVLGHEAAQHFLEEVSALVTYLAPCYLEQDKKQLVIAIGCTGGMHRSVAMGEELFARLQEKGCRVAIEHRDLNLEKASIESRFPDSKSNS
ncbi:MAG: RNase adapter RapZ [Christensenellaceae bacterium]|nr:RNase adapter RapZ [Christensenellaceae bacterium]